MHRRAMALGARAERLAWVFQAGYQSAVRACFPEFHGPGLSCLAATTREGAEPCRLEEDGPGWRLYGEKTWIAAVDHVARLVVAVDTADGPVFAHVPRDAAGLTLENPRPASFLAELSQGTARFEGVALGPDALLLSPAHGSASMDMAAVAPAERGSVFRSAERYFVCTALAARMDCEEALNCVGWDGVGYLRAIVSRNLNSLRDALAQALPAFEAERLPTLPAGLRASFETDRRLLKMFVGV